MFRLNDEIKAAKFETDVAATYRFEEGHGLHAFVFLSFIFAEALKLLIETWIDVKELDAPKIIFLATITILTAQYWWVVYRSAFFYGKSIFNLCCGALESSLFYAIAYLLRCNEPLRTLLFLFASMVLVFMLVDIARYFEFVKKPQRTGIRHVAPRQLLRLTAIVVAVLAGLHRIRELTAALVLLLLVLAYMRMTAWAREQ